MIVLSFLLATFGFLLFALATDQHHGKRFRSACPKPRAIALRTAACVCLALGFALSLRAWGPVIGPIGWVATLMAGAALVFCGVNFAPQAPRPPRG